VIKQEKQIDYLYNFFFYLCYRTHVIMGLQPSLRVIVSCKLVTYSFCEVVAPCLRTTIVHPLHQFLNGVFVNSF
jgi:hypothetical protein